MQYIQRIDMDDCNNFGCYCFFCFGNENIFFRAYGENYKFIEFYLTREAYSNNTDGSNKWVYLGKLYDQH
jgi:hypothetical protein